MLYQMKTRSIKPLLQRILFSIILILNLPNDYWYQYPSGLSERKAVQESTESKILVEHQQMLCNQYYVCIHTGEEQGDKVVSSLK